MFQLRLPSVPLSRALCLGFHDSGCVRNFLGRRADRFTWGAGDVGLRTGCHFGLVRGQDNGVRNSFTAGLFLRLGFHLRGPGSDWDSLRLKVGLPCGNRLDGFTDGCLGAWNDSGLWDLGDLGYRHIDSLGFQPCCLGSATGGCRDVLSGASRRSIVTTTWSGNNESA